MIEASRRNGLIGSRTPCSSFPDDRVRFARPASYGWTISPLIHENGSQNSTLIVDDGSRGTRTHKRVLPATCFQDRALIRPDDFHFQKFGQQGRVGLEPTLGYLTSTCSAAELPTRTGIRTNSRWACPPVGTMRHTLAQRISDYFFQTVSKVPCGNRTRISRVEAWRLCRSAKSTLRYVSHTF